MTKHHRLFLIFMLALAGCASEPVPPPVVVAEPAPVEVTPYVAPPDQPPPPDQPSSPYMPSPPDLTLPPDTPVKPEQTTNGRYRIAVASVRTAEQAAEWTQRIQAKGYRVETESAEIEGASWQRLVLPGYRNKSDAMAAIGFAEQDLGVSGVWRLPKHIPSAAPAPEPVAAPAPEPAPVSEPAPAN